LSAEAIDKLLRINKQEFKDNDKSNNTSMDDNDLDAEIGMIESTIEDN
jgi:predicted membrane GTPase involved in stress response